MRFPNIRIMHKNHYVRNVWQPLIGPIITSLDRRKHPGCTYVAFGGSASKTKKLPKVAPTCFAAHT